mmetsp:Transcript_9802/g.15723  ORF Transcript_9802/g.15723 Transcript_9802/m.15723 type:complete len:661 (+) Transcript_9802:74-2056(+)
MLLSCVVVLVLVQVLVPVKVTGFVDGHGRNYFARVRYGGLQSSGHDSATARDLQGTLEEMYNIPDPEIFFCDDSASFVLRFDVSDYLLDEMFTYDMYAHDSNRECTININSNTYLTPGMVFDETPRGDGSGFRQVAFYLEADSNIIESSPVYYTPEEIGDPDSQPYINFCTRIMTSSESGMLVNWVDIEFFFFLELDKQGFFPDARKLLHQANIPVEKEGFVPLMLGEHMDEDMDPDSDDISEQSLISFPDRQRRRRLLNCFDGFNVVFNVATTAAPTAPLYPTISPAPSPAVIVVQPEQVFNMSGTRSQLYATDSYGVIGYLCNENLERIGDGDEPAVVPQFQGETTARVCVERNEKCVRDGIFIRRIDAFSFFRDSNRQVAVAPVNLPAKNGLTELFCERGSHKCHFVTLLSAQFFGSPGFVAGSGAASLQFGTSNGRLLQESEDDEVESKTKGFRLAFEITILPQSLGTDNVVLDSGLGIVGIIGIIVSVFLFGLCILLLAFAIVWFYRDRKECQYILNMLEIPYKRPETDHKDKKQNNQDRSHDKFHDEELGSSPTCSSRRKDPPESIMKPAKKEKRLSLRRLSRQKIEIDEVQLEDLEKLIQSKETPCEEDKDSHRKQRKEKQGSKRSASCNRKGRCNRERERKRRGSASIIDIL